MLHVEVNDTVCAQDGAFPGAAGCCAGLIQCVQWNGRCAVSCQVTCLNAPSECSTGGTPCCGEATCQNGVCTNPTTGGGGSGGGNTGGGDTGGDTGGGTGGDQNKIQCCLQGTTIETFREICEPNGGTIGTCAITTFSFRNGQCIADAAGTQTYMDCYNANKGYEYNAAAGLCLTKLGGVSLEECEAIKRQQQSSQTGQCPVDESAPCSRKSINSTTTISGEQYRCSIDSGSSYCTPTLIQKPHCETCEDSPNQAGCLAYCSGPAPEIEFSCTAGQTKCINGLENVCTGASGYRPTGATCGGDGTGDSPCTSGEVTCIEGSEWVCSGSSGFRNRNVSCNSTGIWESTCTAGEIKCIGGSNWVCTGTSGFRNQNTFCVDQLSTVLGSNRGADGNIVEQVVDTIRQTPVIVRITEAVIQAQAGASEIAQEIKEIINNINLTPEEVRNAVRKAATKFVCGQTPPVSNNPAYGAGCNLNVAVRSSTYQGRSCYCDPLSETSRGIALGISCQTNLGAWQCNTPTQTAGQGGGEVIDECRLCQRNSTCSINAVNIENFDLEACIYSACSGVCPGLTAPQTNQSCDSETSVPNCITAEFNEVVFKYNTVARTCVPESSESTKCIEKSDVTPGLCPSDRGTAGCMEKPINHTFETQTGTNECYFDEINQYCQSQPISTTRSPSINNVLFCTCIPTDSTTPCNEGGSYETNESITINDTQFTCTNSGWIGG